MSQWVIDIKTELNNRRNAQIEGEQGWRKRSIYKLPPLISELNAKAYQPQAVSFGPYHHGEPHLELMEHHKQRAFLHFLERSPVSLDIIFNSMVEVAQDLKDSYDSLEPKRQHDIEKFVKLMIVDECFVLEIMRVWTERKSDYSDDYPLFGSEGDFYVVWVIRRDMLFLENQLPILVLFKLQGIKENDKVAMEELNRLILHFFEDHSNFEMGKSLHILDLYRKSLLVKRSKSTEPLSKLPSRQGLHPSISATVLNEAGIRFRKSKINYGMDISFDDGILSLPAFFVEDATVSTFLNLIAFERCHIGDDHAITSFICFMGDIICHDRDIGLLISEGIIFNLVGTDKVAANLFHMMSKDLMIDPSSDLFRMTDSIISYCNKPWRKWRAELIRTYFRNPWAIISVVSAVILFTLNTLQTGFTVYDVMRK
ncbi:UPF0481 protein At3g47200-like [Diospyros lotus]|uniref:UPF0481 protein At3g47200-like n=1 Tax=Diospyros lotus TaxID=55363 RepID=UPI0022572D21|nr:UPF0481 protein At3g47200-like [Diospyros lotus]